ncbi:MAG: hypothetical protein H6978_09455 [Gammaproteobacteria bacterium]|nr:hypothetical protein [Gammaproteobacteria bacterium]
MRKLLLVLVSVALSACGGWHLRGTQLAELGIRSVELRTSGAPILGNQLRQALLYSGVTVNGRNATPDVSMIVSNEQFDRRVLSVDAETGKVREVEVGLRVDFQLLDAQGLPLTERRQLEFERDFVFDELRLLGTVEQENLIRQALAEDAANSLLIRLDAVRSSSK